MGAVVVPVHQTGLGRRRDLLEQRVRDHRVHAVRIHGEKALAQQTRHGGVQFFQTVQAARGAAAPESAADQAAAFFFPGELLPVETDHVHVEQAAHGAAVLDPHADLLDRRSRGFDGAEKLVSRVGVRDLPGGAGDPGLSERVVQHPQALVESAADHRAVLDGAGDVHGKGDQRAGKLLQKPPLRLRPAVPGVQYLLQRHFSHQ